MLAFFLLLLLRSFLIVIFPPLSKRSYRVFSGLIAREISCIQVAIDLGVGVTLGPLAKRTGVVKLLIAHGVYISFRCICL